MYPSMSMFNSGQQPMPIPITVNGHHGGTPHHHPPGPPPPLPPSPIIPLKRKLPSPGVPPVNHHPSLPRRAPVPASPAPPSTQANTSGIDCICGYTHDDGNSIACDACGRWYHIACLFTAQNLAFPQRQEEDDWEWFCPRKRCGRERKVDVERAKRGQAVWILNHQHSALDISYEMPQRSHLIHHRRHHFPHTQNPGKLSFNQQMHLTPTYQCTRLLHTTFVPRTTIPGPGLLVTPFPSRVLPASYWLSSSPSASAYALSGIPPVHVSTVGAPLNLVLDTREVGSKARWVRRGCWPNAVIGRYQANSSDPKDVEWGLISTRRIEEGEEVVIPWEWDDACAVHELGGVVTEPVRYP
ncbi:hypothetical protein DL96DRAFT_121217 [Flagelloscypha sp. PMI_526]|nr:hypothetical protein DL96DRAFT_121217 [Flagelloscypha sp. PMI_526]